MIIIFYMWLNRMSKKGLGVVIEVAFAQHFIYYLYIIYIQLSIIYIWFIYYLYTTIRYLYMIYLIFSDNTSDFEINLEQIRGLSPRACAWRAGAGAHYARVDKFGPSLLDPPGYNVPLPHFGGGVGWGLSKKGWGMVVVEFAFAQPFL